MASAFSEARRAARLLQQFGGFHFCRDDIRFSPLFVGVAIHQRPFLPRFVCAVFVSALVRSTALRSVVAALPRRVSSNFTSACTIVAREEYPLGYFAAQAMEVSCRLDGDIDAAAKEFAAEAQMFFAARDPSSAGIANDA